LTTGHIARVSVLEKSAGARLSPDGCLSFADATFNLVIARLALHQVAGEFRRARLLREMRRVLKPGGKLVVIDRGLTHQHLNVLTSAEMRVINRRPECVMLLPRLEVLIAQAPLGRESWRTPLPARGHQRLRSSTER
jgi:SAM-dependent methyltransferase